MYTRSCFILAFLFTCLAAKSQDIVEKKIQYGIYTSTGGVIKDHSGLNTLFINNDGLSKNLYLTSNIGMVLNIKKVRFFIDGQRTLLSEELSESSRVEIMDVMANFNLGYDFELGRGFTLTPTAGMSIIESRLEYLREYDSPSSASSLLNFPFGSNRLNLSRLYAGIGLLTSYHIDFLDEGTFPLYFILKTDYREAVSSAVWTDAFDNELSGDNLMSRNLSFSFGFLWMI